MPPDGLATILVSVEIAEASQRIENPYAKPCSKENTMNAVATRPETTETMTLDRKICSHCGWSISDQAKVDGGSEHPRHPKYHIIM